MSQFIDPDTEELVTAGSPPFYEIVWMDFKNTCAEQFVKDKDEYLYVTDDKLRKVFDIVFADIQLKPRKT